MKKRNVMFTFILILLTNFETNVITIFFVSVYRHNFCLTLAEVEAPTGEWKIQVSIVLFTVSLALFYLCMARKFCKLTSFSNLYG